MFDFLKRSSKSEHRNETPQILGIKLGGALEINSLKFKILEPLLTCENIAKLQLIQAVGVVKLDQNNHIVRYYTDDDGFIQIVLSGGMTDNHINDVKLWYFFDTQAINSDQQWETALNHEISQQQYRLDEEIFTRYWNDTNNNPPVAMTEITYSEDDQSSETDQFIMLYNRPLENGEEEFLMVSGEESENHNEQLERCIVTSTGINLSSADFTIVS